MERLCALIPMSSGFGPTVSTGCCARTPKTLSHSHLKPRKVSLETSPPIQLHKIDSEDSSKRKGAFSHSPGSLQSLPTNTARKRHFIEFSLCLSRACLGKIMHLMYKWRKKVTFSHLRAVVWIEHLHRHWVGGITRAIEQSCRKSSFSICQFLSCNTMICQNRLGIHIRKVVEIGARGAFSAPPCVALPWSGKANSSVQCGSSFGCAAKRSFVSTFLTSVPSLSWRRIVHFKFFERK